MSPAAHQIPIEEHPRRRAPRVDPESFRAAVLPPSGLPIDLPTIMRDHLELVDQRIGAIELQQDALQKAVDENTAMTAKIQADTAQLVEVAKALDGLVKFFAIMGKVAKPIAWLIVALLGIAIMTGGALYSLKAGLNLPSK